MSKVVIHDSTGWDFPDKSAHIHSCTVSLVTDCRARLHMEAMSGEYQALDRQDAVLGECPGVLGYIVGQRGFSDIG